MNPIPNRSRSVVPVDVPSSSSRRRQGEPAQWATAFGPATIGNVGAGFDVLGFAVEAVGDRVRVERIAEREVRVGQITGVAGELPRDPRRNTATAGLVQLLEDFALPFGFEVHIDKGIALGSGMGGSAASAAAAVVAASALLDTPLDLPQRMHYALIGESVASGSAHADNLAPCLYGGLTLVRGAGVPEVIRLPVPPMVRCVLVHPHMRIDTRQARAILAGNVSLERFVEQSANLAGLIAGCFTQDLELIGRSLVDVVIEPQRAALIPGFAEVQQAARAYGALGCSIAGAGPTVFAWCDQHRQPKTVAVAMSKAFAQVGLASDAWISPINGIGAHVCALHSAAHEAGDVSPVS